MGVAERAAAEGKRLNRLLREWVRKWGFYIVLESDLMGWRVGVPALFCPAMPLGMSGVSRKRGSVLPGSVSGRRSIHFPVRGAVKLENGINSPVSALSSMGLVAFFQR